MPMINLKVILYPWPSWKGKLKTYGNIALFQSEWLPIIQMTTDVGRNVERK